MSESPTEMDAATRASLEAENKMLRQGAVTGGGFWLGVISILLAPFGTGPLFGILGAVFCLAGLRDREFRWMALASLLLCAVGTALGLWAARWHLRALSGEEGFLPPWHAVLLAVGMILTLFGLSAALRAGWVVVRHTLGAPLREDLKPSPHAQFAGGTGRVALDFRELEIAWRVETPSWTPGGLAVGDWNGDGESEVLLLDGGCRLHVLNADGQEVDNVGMKGDIEQIAIGRAGGRTLLAGYRNWCKQVTVCDAGGDVLWKHPHWPRLKWGINQAQWADIDGDGHDELIIGMNGAGGVRALDRHGKVKWIVRRIGNAWNQGVIPAADPESAVIASTGASGHIALFNGHGKRLATRKPGENYWCSLCAAREATGEERLFAIGTPSTRVGRCGTWHSAWVAGISLREKGHWRAPVWTHNAAWRTPQLAVGDLTGNGEPDVAFLCHPQVVNVASAAGKLLVDLREVRPQQVLILSRKGEPGLLIVGEERQVTAWRLRPTPNEGDEALEARTVEWEEALR